MTYADFRITMIARAAAMIGTGENLPNRSAFIDEANQFTGAPRGSPYCLSALLYLAHCICVEYKFPIDIMPFSSAVSFYRASLLKIAVTPEPGSVMIWQRRDDESKGHAALVTEVLPNGMIRTIEFNTSSAGSAVNREGDGCYSKIRSAQGTQNMRVLGFIRL